MADEVDRERRLAECREQLFFRRHELLADGGEIPAAEMRILQTAVPRVPSENEGGYRKRLQTFLDREESRIQTILSLQAAAGAIADRAAADKLAETTQARLDVEGPGLLAEIQRLQMQLMELHQAADGARTASEKRHEAVAALRRDDLLPSYVKDELAAARRENKNDFGRELIGLESRRTQIQGALGIDYASSDGYESIKCHVSTNPRFGSDQFERLEAMFYCEWFQAGAHRAFRVGKIREDRWNEYCGSLREELDSVESRILEITNGQQADADAKMEAMRSYYIPE